MKLTALTILLLSPLASHAAEKATARPIGVCIVWEDLKDEMDGFPTLNSQHPVTLAAVVSVDGRKIVTEPGFRNELEGTMQDDKGTDLGRVKLGMARLSKSGGQMRFHITAEKLPAAGATKLVFKGSIPVELASKTASEKSALTELAVDSKGEAGGVSFTISSTGKPDWGDDPLEVGITYTRKIPNLKEVRFYDETGKLIPSKPGAYRSTTFLGKTKVVRKFKLSRKARKATIEFVTWTDLEKRQVPLDITAGLSR